MYQRNGSRARRARALPIFALALLLASPVAPVAQTPPAQPAPRQDKQGGGMGGVTTGEARTYTSRRTVGIFDDKAAAAFEDVTAKTALATFRNRSGDLDKNYILEATAAGVAVFDYDNDGWPDIYLLSGSALDG